MRIIAFAGTAVAGVLMAGAAEGAQYDLNGEWKGTFNVSNGPTQIERVMVYQSGEAVRAVKITGDANVPAGKETFHGTYSASSFPGQQQCAGVGFTNPVWSDMTVTVADASHFTVNGGCGMAVSVWERVGKPTLALDDAILFDTGKSELKGEAGPALAGIVQIIGSMHPKARFVVAGYTDDRGGDAFNLALSRKRAESVAAALKKQGIAAARLTIAGHGKADPRFPNTNDDARAHNRRVEIVIQD